MARNKGESFEITRMQIIQCATELMTEKGIYNTSLADIAKTVKMSKGTLYYYYPSKEHLINDIAELHLGDITNGLISWIDALNHGASTVESVKGLLDNLLGNSALGKVHFVLLNEAMLGNESLVHKFRTKYREFNVMLEAGLLKTSGYTPDQIKMFSRVFFAVLDGYTLQKMLGIEKMMLDDIASLLLPDCRELGKEQSGDGKI